MIPQRFLLTIIILLALSNVCCSSEDQTFKVVHDDREQIVLYDLFIDPVIKESVNGVLICVGGLELVNDVYGHSSTQECRSEVWRDFARENHLAILGIGFKFDPQDWPTKTSYQYAQSWSGQAVADILNLLAEKEPININHLYLYGVSAGAQFVIRYAYLFPEQTHAVTAHASGGFDYPEKFIPTQILLTVGDLDNEDVKRRDNALEYQRLCEEFGIAINVEVIEEIGHIQTERQNQMSREFISKVISSKQ